jgi:hypothetical protein
MAQKVLRRKRESSYLLREEIKAFRSFIIGVLGKDPEGEYRPGFVREILKASREKAIFTFRGRESFLRQLKKISIGD